MIFALFWSEIIRRVSTEFSITLSSRAPWFCHSTRVSFTTLQRRHFGRCFRTSVCGTMLRSSCFWCKFQWSRDWQLTRNSAIARVRDAMYVLTVTFCARDTSSGSTIFVFSPFVPVRVCYASGHFAFARVHNNQSSNCLQRKINSEPLEASISLIQLQGKRFWGRHALGAMGFDK